MKKARTIAVFVHCFPPAHGGVEKLAGMLYELLSSENDVHVFTGQGQNLDSYKRFETLTLTQSTSTIHRLPLRTFWQRLSNKCLNKVIFKISFFSPWYFGPWLKYSETERKIIAAADVIIGLGMPTLSFYDSYRLASRYHKKLIVIPAYHDVSYYNGSVPFQQALQYADTVFFLSDKEQADCLRHYVIDQKKIRRLPVGIFSENEIDRQRSKMLKKSVSLSSKSAITIGTIGQVAARKNLSIYRQLIPLLEARFPDRTFTFLLAGMKTNTAAQVEQELAPYLGRNLSITYNPESVTELYNKIDIFLNPSVEESFGIVNFEAMFYGKPIVVHQDSALTSQSILQFRTVPELIDTVEYLVTNDKGLQNQLRNQYILLSEYSTEKFKHALNTAL